MINEEQERDRICEKVFQAVVKHRKTDVSSRIRDMLRKEKHYLTIFSNYELFIYALTVWATINRKEKEATDLFINTFYEEFKNTPKFKELIPMMLFDLVGLLDMVSISFEGTFFKRLLFQSEQDNERLIVGETGTGKQFFAKAFHLMGNRNKRPFQEINCVAIPEQMLESELFGHEKGAFTGADKQRKGLLELADDGIIFLDELGKMPKRLQAKILKAIQDKTFRRVGGNDTFPIKARFIAAVQPDDLKENILPDLKYRFGHPNNITVPSLYDRIKINPRAVIFSALNQVKRSMGVEKGIRINKQAVSLLCNYDYKGNFRELCTILEAGLTEALMDNRNEILPEDVTDILNTDKNNFVQNAEHELDSIKLKDVFDYAEDIKKTIIEKKISRVLNSGKNIKTALSEEGLNQEKDYQNFRKKVVNITGKNLKELI